ncbi:MAG: cupin domain-containing protein [Acetobacteraceae bacterium]|nr:cupin domain-containing protein [Acetobacteraceae bacterium]
MGRHVPLAEMQARLVRYADLVPCLNAFVDTRNPRSEAKENFTIIGPGVSENPAQHVHISEPHGFNVGGARQPPGCVNSQHSHLTAETFYVLSGRWRFDFGEHGDDVQVEAGPGTIASIPPGMFRGFTNIGHGPGFLWVVLGGDDPGHVTWAPQVFEMAERFGLKLLANGRLVDTAADEAVPPGAALLPPPSPVELQTLKTPPRSLVEACFVAPGAAGGPGFLAAPGVQDSLIIGPGGPLDWAHGFTLSRLAFDGGTTAWHAQTGPEVLFAGRGRIRVDWSGGTLDLEPGDTLSVPVGLPRRLSGDGELIAVRRGDAAMRPEPVA